MLKLKAGTTMDYYTYKASKMFKVPVEDVTSCMRRAVKRMRKEPTVIKKRRTYCK